MRIKSNYTRVAKFSNCQFKDSKQKIKDKIVIIGAGTTGLILAAGLAKFYTNVIIIEKGTVLTQEGNDTSKNMHVHHILEAGQKIIEALFPNFMNTLIEKEAKKLNYFNDIHIVGSEHFQNTLSDLDINIFTISKIKFDNLLYDKIKEIANIQILENTKVLAIPKNYGRINNLPLIHNKKYKNMSDCGIVVDCSGSNSNIFSYLPKSRLNESIEVNIHYFSIQARLELGQKKGIICVPPYPSQYFLVLMPIEDNNILITLGKRFHKSFSIKTREEFVIIFNEITKNNNLNLNISMEHIHSDVFSYFQPNSYRNIGIPTYENVFVLGDNTCLLTAMTGQGVSLAILEVFSFIEHLKTNNFKINSSFQELFMNELVDITLAPWLRYISRDINRFRKHSPKIVNNYEIELKKYKLSASKDNFIKSVLSQHFLSFPEEIL